MIEKEQRLIGLLALGKPRSLPLDDEPLDTQQPAAFVQSTYMIIASPHSSTYLASAPGANASGSSAQRGSGPQSAPREVPAIRQPHTVAYCGR